MHLNNNAKQLIKKLEGLRLQLYKCSAGTETIGYGHVMQEHESWMKRGITNVQAVDIFENDIISYTADVEELCMQKNIQLNANQFGALVSFAFNLGMAALKRSTLLQVISDNTNNYSEIKKQFLRWIYVSGKPSEGIKSRRLTEFELYKTPVRNATSENKTNHTSVSFFNIIKKCAPTVASIITNPVELVVAKGMKMLSSLLGHTVKTQSDVDNVIHDKIAKDPNFEIILQTKLYKLEIKMKKELNKSLEIQLAHKNLKESIDDTENARSHFDHDKRLFWPMITIILVIATFGFFAFFWKLENGNRDFLYSILGQLTTVLGTMATFFYGASIIKSSAGNSK